MIVITGAAGFIGSNLLISLREAGRRDIVVCDRLGQDERWRNLRKHGFMQLIAPENLPYFIEENHNEIEMVFHLGAVSDTTATDADYTLANNFDFSLALLDACAHHEIRFIYASSAATYGDGSRGYKDDESLGYLETLQPLNLYGWSKHLFDLEIARRKKAGALMPPQCAGLKFFNVYGPNEHHKGEQMSVVCKAYPVVAGGGAVKLFKSDRAGMKDGEQRRDFVYVGDCCRVMQWLHDNAGVSGLFNVGTGKARTFNDLFAALKGAVGNDRARLEYIDMPRELVGKYQYETQAEMSKLQGEGFSDAPTSLEAGIGEYVGYLKRADAYR